MNITLQHGLSRSLTREFSDNTTIAQIAADATVKAALGLGDNVSALVDGRVLSPNEVPVDGDCVVFEKTAAAKA